jgi:hypothetical protein
VSRVAPGPGRRRRGREAPVDGRLSELPADVGDEHREADVEDRAGDDRAHGLAGDEEHVHAPELAEEEDGDQQQQDARSAPDHLLIVLPPSVPLNLALAGENPVEGIAERCVGERHRDDQQETREAGRGADRVAGEARQRREAVHADDVGDDGDVPDVGQDSAQAVG